MTSPTPNKGYTYPAHGGAVNAWDTPLNTDFDYIDLNVGGIYNINCGSSIVGVVQNSTYATVSSTVSTITLNTSLAQNMYYYVNGTLSSSFGIVFPTSIGSFYVLTNATAGGFEVYAKTANAGSSFVDIGGTKMIVTDGTSPVLVNAFESGTAMLFRQTTPPVGWTKVTSFNNYALRVVSGTISNGGSLGFTTAFSAATATTAGNATVVACTAGCAGTGVVSLNTHTHTVNLDVAYVDVIIATKD